MAIRIGNGMNISGIEMPTSVPGVNNAGDFSTDFHNLLTKEMSELNGNDRERATQTGSNAYTDEDWRRVLEDFDANEEAIMRAMHQSLAKRLQEDGMFDEKPSDQVSPVSDL